MMGGKKTTENAVVSQMSSKYERNFCELFLFLPGLSLAALNQSLGLILSVAPWAGFLRAPHVWCEEVHYVAMVLSSSLSGNQWHPLRGNSRGGAWPSGPH